MLFQCPKLTPLQSRFVASFAALLFIGLIYWSLSNPHFAYAAEQEFDGSGQSRGGEDHNWHRIQERLEEDDGLDGAEVDGVHARQGVTANAISANNAPNPLNIMPGNTTLWIYPSELLSAPPGDTGPGLPSVPGAKRDAAVEHAELRRRQDVKIIYVSINTCLQPIWTGDSSQTEAPPQLTLYVSGKTDDTNIGPNGDSDQIVAPLVEGFANASVQASGAWYIAVSAPELPDGFTGVWAYEIAVSTDAYYHSANLTDSFLFLVDTDIDSALLVTGNLTDSSSSNTVVQEWLNLTSPFTMFAVQANYTNITGVTNSYCAWSNAPRIADNNVQTKMITRGLDNLPKEQFYITGLDSSTDYTGVLAIAGNSTASGAGVVGGGGKIWTPIDWTTKSDGNCALIFNLSFCSEVAYAVPSNPNVLNLSQIYDNYTQTMYQQFDFSLQQIACDTSSDAQYSLARNCTDCAAAYKEWLCAVSIPRCEDFSNPAGYLQPRAMGYPFFNNNSMLPSEILNQQYIPMSKAPTLPGTLAYSQTYLSAWASNSSRNPALIDEQIHPGPWKELLPCEDLCWGLVQSCPSALGFACPYPGRGLEAGYGNRSGNGNRSLTCNYLGAVYDLNAGNNLLAPVFSAVMIAGLVTLVLGVA